MTIERIKTKKKKAGNGSTKYNLNTKKKKKKKEIKIREKINRGRQAMLKRSKVMASEKNEEGVKRCESKLAYQR